MSELFSALGDTSRIRINRWLAKQKMNVAKLSEQVGLTHSAVSHQLQLLR